MPQDKNSSTVDFLNNIDKEDVFKEEPEVVEEKEEEKPISFHKDPKVQRYVQKEIAKAMEGLKPSAEQQFKEEVRSDVEDVIGAFTTIIGNDTPEKVRALKALERTLQGADERASSKAIERFQQQIAEDQRQATEQDIAVQQELNDSFEEIEENYNVDLSSNSTSAKKLRSEFIDYIRDVAHKDANGEVDQFPDLDATFRRFQSESRHSAPASRAKELASRGMTRSTDTTTAAPTGRSWKDVDRFFSKLKDNN